MKGKTPAKGTPKGTPRGMDEGSHMMGGMPMKDGDMKRMMGKGRKKGK